MTPISSSEAAPASRVVWDVSPGRRLISYLLRVGEALAVLWATASLTFLAQLALPGDRAALLLNARSGSLTTPTQAELDAINAKYGFSASAPAQYFDYMRRLLHGDLGVSYQSNQPVSDIILGQLGPTLALSASALALAWVIAIATTAPFAGRRSRLGSFLAGLQIVFATTPPYWIGSILLVTFAVEIPIFPVEGENSLWGLVLPAASLALPLAGYIAQLLHAEFANVLEQPFVLQTRARGVGEFTLRLRHALRHAVLPGLSLSGWAIGSLFSGAALIETLFARQGIGGVLVNAAGVRDVPLVTGVILVSAAMYVVANLIVDEAYLIVDPRMKRA